MIFLAQLADTPEIVEPRQSDLTWIAVAGMLQPFVTELLTKYNVSPGVKRLVNFILAALVGTANALYEDNQNGGPFDWKRAMIVTAGVWLTSVTAYVHLWKDSAPLNKVDEATAGFGVGTTQPTVQPVPNVPPSVNMPAPPVTNPPTSSVLADLERARVEAASGFNWQFTATPIAAPPPPPEVPVPPA